MTTYTLQQSGGDFSTLASFLADAGTTSGDVCNPTGTWSIVDSANCTVVDDNITIAALTGSRHPGYADEGGSPSHYRLYCSTNGDHCIEITTGDGFHIIGIDIKQNSTGSSDECIRLSDSGAEITIEKLLVHSPGTTADQDGLYTGNINCTFNVYDCIIYNFDRACIHPQMFLGSGLTQTWNIRSCTIINGGTGDTQEGGGITGRAEDAAATLNINIFNTIALESNGASGAQDYRQFASGSGTHNWDIHQSFDSDNSIASRDGSAVDCQANMNLTDDNTKASDGDWVIVFETAVGSEDFRLQSNIYNEAQDYSATASGAGMTISSTSDIVYTDRPQNTNYDVGAFEVEVILTTLAPTTAPPAEAIMNQIQKTNLGADLYNGTLQ